MSPTIFDCCVIGSGFGGSVCALRAAEAGLRTVLLERGPRLTSDDFNDLAAGKRPIVRSNRAPDGIAEIHAVRGMGALTANAVGGGSQLYTAVTVPAPPEIFTRAWCGISSTSLEPHYVKVRNIIAPSVTPIALPRTIALERACSRIGGTMVQLPVAMDWPDNAGELAHVPSFLGVRGEAAAWLQGGRCSNKRTLDRTYLAKAEALGAEIRAMHEVTAIAPAAEGYDVAFRCSTASAEFTSSLRARRVVMAAGTLGTLRLLFRCRDEVGSLPQISDALGERFFMNGDMGALIVGACDGPAPDCGPSVTGWIDFWREDRLFLMELAAWPTGFGLSALSPKFGSAWCIGVMGYDDNPSRITVTRRGRLSVQRDASRSEKFDQRRLKRLRELAAAIGGKLLVIPSWIERRMPMTVHPMGGAAIADSPEKGVVNAFGEVFGYPGLYVADASLFPTPTGVAPSMTIAAMAERVMEKMLESNH